MPTVHRRHGFYVLVMVIGWVLPPVAVLLRFGFGFDFFLNILLTIAGYIPGHGHNFYLQNIRNNTNRKRTPAWATKAGLIKDPGMKRKQKTQWANRYDERTPTRSDGYEDEDRVLNRSNSSSSLSHHHQTIHHPSSDPRDSDHPHRSLRRSSTELEPRRRVSRESFYSNSNHTDDLTRTNPSRPLHRSLSSRIMKGFSGTKSTKKDR
ncbi:hypothetical protein DFH28DRAFT_891193 [Melampsora americana]|nr:hypothetical protein DFH28DRAFT_891193 [Melampsora americana]